ncbi:MAG: hypothetical protein A2542_01550 [Parcubacteria group bacterium RIFOXYD2_FULL_52_8]|nr:MAG: hypothetical protein A2542_01550 [Parcubacteria group bacterium RIFOXYD2_FULL_52_8]
MSQKAILWFVVAVVVVLGVGYMMSNRAVAPAEVPAGESATVLPGSESVATSSEPVTPTEAGIGVNGSVGGGATVAGPSTQSFTVTGSNFSFAPAQMRVKQGDTVKITFVNSNGFHDLVIDEFTARTKQLAAGASETIQFVADKKGSFEYYCSIGTHRQMGMKGTLIVE